MSLYHFADQFLQHGLNVLVSFFLISLLTQLSLKVFQIKRNRYCATLRLLPPLRLALEPLFWLLPASPLFVNASILSCSHPIQRHLFGKLSEAAQQELNDHGIYTITGHFLLKLPSAVILGAILSVIAISLYRLVAYLLQAYLSVKEIQGIKQRAEKNPRAIQNSKLLEKLGNRQILLSDEVDTPLAAFGNAIILPKDLQLSQEEFEAVLSHELEHLRFKDTAVRILLQSVAAIYWWVPMKKWLKTIEHEQELASDDAVHHYELKGLDLASALKKTVEREPIKGYNCSALSNKGLLERIVKAVGSTHLQKQNRLFALLGALILLGVILSLRFIIC